MFNKVILIGRLGKNAEVKTAQNKKEYSWPFPPTSTVAAPASAPPGT